MFPIESWTFLAAEATKGALAYNIADEGLAFKRESRTTDNMSRPFHQFEDLGNKLSYIHLDTHQAKNTCPWPSSMLKENMRPRLLIQCSRIAMHQYVQRCQCRIMCRSRATSVLCNLA
jgi:hypothetical protein